jgi:hypothetical protein
MSGGRNAQGVVLDFDATLITAHSDKEHAAGNCKSGSGFHRPIVAGNSNGDIPIIDFPAIRTSHSSRSSSCTTTPTASSTTPQVPSSRSSRPTRAAGRSSVTRTTGPRSSRNRTGKEQRRDRRWLLPVLKRVASPSAPAQPLMDRRIASRTPGSMHKSARGRSIPPCRPPSTPASANRPATASPQQPGRRTGDDGSMELVLLGLGALPGARRPAWSAALRT